MSAQNTSQIQTSNSNELSNVFATLFRYIAMLKAKENIYVNVNKLIQDAIYIECHEDNKWCRIITSNYVSLRITPEYIEVESPSCECVCAGP